MQFQNNDQHARAGKGNELKALSVLHATAGGTKGKAIRIEIKTWIRWYLLLLEFFTQALKDTRVLMQYESLYGEIWEVTYAKISHRKVD